MQYEENYRVNMRNLDTIRVSLQEKIAIQQNQGASLRQRRKKPTYCFCAHHTCAIYGTYILLATERPVVYD